MHYKKVSLLVVGVIVFIAIAIGCAKQEPPAYGAMLDDGGELTELPEFEGLPTEQELAVVPETTNPKQTLVYWHPRADIASLKLIADAGHGLPVDIALSRGKDDVITIRPNKPLRGGVYCLVQEDPLGTPYGLPTYCFKMLVEHQ